MAATDIQRGRGFIVGNMTEMAHLVMENEKLRRKVKKAQQRRDHYARLYYRVLAELDETKWEVTMSRNKIRELKSQVTASQQANTAITSHPVPMHSNPNGNNTALSHVSGSNTTSPDSGTSLSPGIEPMNPAHENRPKTPPDMMRHPSRDATRDITSFGLHHKLQAQPPPKEAWNMEKQKHAHMEPQFVKVEQIQAGENGLTSSLKARKLPKPPREAFASPRLHFQPAFSPNGPHFDKSFSFSQGDSTPGSVASPLLTAHRKAAGFHLPYTLSQDSFISSPPSVRRPAFEQAVGMPRRYHTPAHPQMSRVVAMERSSLSQDDVRSWPNGRSAFEQSVPQRNHTVPMSAPPQVKRLPSFERSFLSHDNSRPVFGQAVSIPNKDHRVPMSAPPQMKRPPAIERSCLSQDDLYSWPQRRSEFEQSVPHRNHVSAPPQMKRPPAIERSCLSQDDLYSWPQRRSEFEQSVPHRNHVSAPPQMKRPPAIERSCLSQDDIPSCIEAPHPSAFKKPHPPRLPVPQLQFDTSSITPGDPNHSPSTFSHVSAASSTTTASSNPPPYPRPDGYLCESLTGVQILDLLAMISDPKCNITKLEVANSQLGQPEAMKLFCKDLLRNKSIVELSLPGNGINKESLKVLLDCIEHCDNITELMLRNNMIGRECAEIIRSFLETTNLDSLVLTGNEIEQYGHLLNGNLPNDFTMEYDTTDGSEDSGLVLVDTENSGGSNDQSLNHRFKYLHL